MTSKTLLYSVIYADPPWSYKAKSLPAKWPTGSAHADHYYKTMPLEEIKALQIPAADDSVLFMWATVPMLPEAFEVLAAWGFRYKTMLTWHKLRCKGMGYWFRGHTEHLLFGVRGKVKAFRSMHRNIVEDRVTKHSEKPERFYELIESVTDGPRLEMFARRLRPGWDSWGEEARSDGRLFA